MASPPPPSSSYNCPICLSPPQCPFSTPCNHIFCYECLSTHLQTRSVCPLCSTYITLDTITPAPNPTTPDLTTHTSSRRNAPPPIPRRTLPQTPSPMSIASRRARAHARARAVLGGTPRMTPPLHEGPVIVTASDTGPLGNGTGTGTGTGIGTGAGAGAGAGTGAGGTSPTARAPGQHLVAAGDQLTAQELAGVIETLSRKLKEKEGGEKKGETELLLEFLRHTKGEKEREIDRLKREVAMLEGDVREAEGERRKFGGAGATVDANKRKRVELHAGVLQSHYFDVVGGVKGGERRKRLRRFTEDVCKLTQYVRLRDRATLMHVARVPEAACADVFKASNIVSSIEFDRESEFLATAGVTRRIKIFEFGNITRNLADVHYPVREIPTAAKLSWVCWNPYIRHHLVSSDYEGFVTLWDVNRGTPLREYEEHESRAWSVDYCPAKPTLFASGSDDGRVKLWTTSHRGSVLTIDNKPANVCSVKFHPHAAEKLAFGSVDFNVHYYDLRNPSEALQVFKSHSRPVSYVKFMSGSELVSASVDSTIKLWDLDTMSLSRTFSGHANDKNFVGLSVTQDYIACGSEENSVFCYYKAIPKPFTGYRFPRVDPLTGEETHDDDESQFVSSVCWCPSNPELLVAANSLGSLRVLALDQGVSPESKESTSE